MQKKPFIPPQNDSSGSSIDYPFQLEKHPKIKGKCPQCGHTKVFRYYEDRDGKRIENAGICDRQSNCGHHAKPNNEQIKAIISQESKPKVEVQKSEIILPDAKILAKISANEKDHSSHFHKFCETLEIPISHLILWGVGTDKTETVFILRNHEKKTANVKYFRYLVTGKRDKTFTSFSMRQPKSLTKKYNIPLYGEHLLDKTRQKTVCVVESEKTAVIASWFYPHFDFVACGAANGLTSEKLSVLFSRKIYWLADADKAGRENSSLKNLKAYEQNFEVIDVFPNRQDGTDLADAIIEGIELSCELIKWKVEETLKNTEPITEKPITRRFTPIQKGLTNEFWYLEETQKHFDEWNFVEYEGRYWFGKYNVDEGTYTFKPVSNFLIKPVLSENQS